MSLKDSALTSSLYAKKLYHSAVFAIPYCNSKTSTCFQRYFYRSPRELVFVICIFSIPGFLLAIALNKDKSMDSKNRYSLASIFKRPLKPACTMLFVLFCKECLQWLLVSAESITSLLHHFLLPATWRTFQREDFLAFPIFRHCSSIIRVIKRNK